MVNLFWRISIITHQVFNLEICCGNTCGDGRVSSGSDAPHLNEQEPSIPKFSGTTTDAHVV